MKTPDNDRRRFRPAKSKATPSGPLGVPVEAVRLWREGTPPGTPPWRYATSLGGIAKALGVNERTAAAWRAAGAPDRDPEYGVYSVAAWHNWKYQNGGAFHHFTRNERLDEATATGDLVRNVLVEYRNGLPTATAAAANELRDNLITARGMTRDQADEIGLLMAAAIAKHIGPLVLTDEQIEDRLVRDWDYV